MSMSSTSQTDTKKRVLFGARSSAPNVKVKQSTTRASKADNSLFADCNPDDIEYPPTKYIEPPFKGLEKKETAVKKTVSIEKRLSQTEGKSGADDVTRDTNIRGILNNKSATDMTGAPKTDEHRPHYTHTTTHPCTDEPVNCAHTTRPSIHSEDHVRKASVEPDVARAVMEAAGPDGDDAPTHATPGEPSANQEALLADPYTPPKYEPTTPPKSPGLGLGQCGDYRGAMTYVSRPEDRIYCGSTYISMDCCNVPDRLTDTAHYCIDSMGQVQNAQELYMNICRRNNCLSHASEVRGAGAHTPVPVEEGDKGKNSRVPDRYVSKYEVIKPYYPMFELEVDVSSHSRSMDSKAEASSAAANHKTHKRLHKKKAPEDHGDPDPPNSPRYVVPTPKKSYVKKFHQLSKPARVDVFDPEYECGFSHLSSDIELRGVESKFSREGSN